VVDNEEANCASAKESEERKKRGVVIDSDFERKNANT
jgi:hypothetical protein